MDAFGRLTVFNFLWTNNCDLQIASLLSLSFDIGIDYSLVVTLWDARTSTNKRARFNETESDKEN